MEEELDVNSYIQSQRKRYSFKEFTDEDSYALRALKKASQNRLFWRYVCELGVPDTSLDKKAIFYYLNGHYRFVSNPYIFMCREKMQPAKWYYKVNETLPKRIEFTPKHEAKDLMYLESVGHIKLEELQKKFTMPILCERYNLSLTQMKNIRYKRLHPFTKRECFKILPPASVIIKLRDVINPDYWYIFPDEI
ncbi:hypothetical protein [Treponema pectinovorum]|uniref:hypothetical protein n=1 Tax=Treponema pectinovorum TaxID=164 RepID=UPI0011F36FAC|nr:hypothetical protein [Treponema pectinovorum]